MRRKKRGVAHEEPRRADLRTLREPGTYLGVEDKAALRLAEAIHYAESQSCAVSWSAQERAEVFYNAHGLAATLDEAARLEAAVLPAEAIEGSTIDGCLNWSWTDE
jgi:hypothetical protein